MAKETATGDGAAGGGATGGTALYCTARTDDVNDDWFFREQVHGADQV